MASGPHTHSLLTFEQLHSVIWRTYADETARLADTDIRDEDLYKFAWQEDDESIWILTDTSPITWAPVTVTGAVSNITAGDGLTGGGTGAVTLDVVANADGSIVVNADDVQVGVLATDAQHGDRGGGSLHADATPAVDGFMSAADKTKLDGIQAGAQVNTDELVGVTGADTTPGYLNNKVVAGAGIGTTVLNGGGDEDLEISADVESVHGRTGAVVAAASDYDADQVDYDNTTSGMAATEVQAAIDEVEGRVDTLEAAPDSDELASVTASDTTPGYLDDKLLDGSGITLTVVNPGGNEQLRIEAAAGSDELVGVSSDDTTPDYLEGKIAAGSGITLATLNPGADEQLEISASGAGFDPRDIVINEHFMTGNTVQDEIALHGWHESGGGTGSGIAVVNAAGHPGIIRVQGGTGGNARRALSIGGDGGNVGLHTIGFSQIEFEVLVAPQVSILALDIAELFVGMALGWGDNAEPNNGIYFRYEPLLTTWQFVTASGGTRTRTNSLGPLVALGTWFRLGFVINAAASSIEAFVNGSSFATHTTNIPSLALSPGIQIRSAGGANNASIDIDYMLIEQVTEKET